MKNLYLKINILICVIFVSLLFTGCHEIDENHPFLGDDTAIEETKAVDCVELTISNGATLTHTKTYTFRIKNPDCSTYSYTFIEDPNYFTGRYGGCDFEAFEVIDIGSTTLRVEKRIAATGQLVCSTSFTYSLDPQISRPPNGYLELGKTYDFRFYDLYPKYRVTFTYSSAFQGVYGGTNWIALWAKIRAWHQWVKADVKNASTGELVKSFTFLYYIQ